MDARELTQKYYELQNRIYELEKKVDLLEQENNIRRLVVEDLKIDVAMLNRTREIKEGR